MNITNGQPNIVNDQLPAGMAVFVKTHRSFIGGIKVHGGGYSAKVIQDLGIVNNRHLISVYTYNGIHTIERQYITTKPLIKKATKDIMVPKRHTITCMDCGTRREVLACNLYNTKRCIKCQKNYAKQQYQKRIASKIIDNQ